MTVVGYLDARDLDSARPHDVAAARRLDRRSQEQGWRLTAVVVGGLTGAAMVTLAGLAMVAWVAIWSAYALAVRSSSQGDDAVLRRVLPIRRRDVVTARYLDTAVLVGLYLGAAALGACLALFSGASPAPELGFMTWVASTMFVVALLVAMPVAFGARRVWLFLVVFAVGMSVLLCLLGAWSAVFGDDYLIRSAAELGAATTVVSLVTAAGIPLSHRSAVRVYARRDL